MTSDGEEERRRTRGIRELVPFFSLPTRTPATLRSAARAKVEICERSPHSATKVNPKLCKKNGFKTPASHVDTTCPHLQKGIRSADEKEDFFVVSPLSSADEEEEEESSGFCFRDDCLSEVFSPSSSCSSTCCSSFLPPVLGPLPRRPFKAATSHSSSSSSSLSSSSPHSRRELSPACG